MPNVELEILLDININPGSTVVDQINHVIIQKVATCPYDRLQLIGCYNYGTYENLQGLCDETQVLTLLNTLGNCFTEFEPIYDETVTSTL